MPSFFLLLHAQVTVVGGAEGVNAVATETEANVVVTGIVGCAGLLPTIEAIKVNECAIQCTRLSTRLKIDRIKPAFVVGCSKKWSHFSFVCSLTFSLLLTFSTSSFYPFDLCCLLLHTHAHAGQETHCAREQGDSDRGRARDFASAARVRSDHDPRGQRTLGHFSSIARSAAGRHAQGELFVDLKID